MEIAGELLLFNRKGLISELMGDKTLLNAGSKHDSVDDDQGGSDSDPSEDNMEEEEMAKIIPIKVGSPKKKSEAKKPTVQVPMKKSFK